MKINVMTWNTGITENICDISKCNNCNNIIDHIECFLKKENSIVFLQQIVFKDPENNWEEHQVFKMLREKFEKEYSMQYYPDSTFMMTIAIAKSGINSLDNDFYPKNTPSNREIAVKYNGISFLGIHAKNGEKNKAYLNAIHGKADVILGDFNAGNYLESENRDVFNNILKEHLCICNMPTKEIYNQNNVLIRKSCIDHIFVRECYVTKCSNLRIHEEIKLSDHYPITFEIDLNDYTYSEREEAWEI